MSVTREFLQSAPAQFQFHSRPDPERSYKFFVRGKGCTLGILFETSVDIYFEWLYEDGQLVDYDPDIRYKAWPKHEFTRLVAAGVWEIVGRSEVPTSIPS
jgi:hypothetical protein